MKIAPAPGRVAHPRRSRASRRGSSRLRPGSNGRRKALAGTSQRPDGRSTSFHAVVGEGDACVGIGQPGASAQDSLVARSRAHGPMWAEDPGCRGIPGRGRCRCTPDSTDYGGTPDWSTPSRAIGQWIAPPLDPPATLSRTVQVRGSSSGRRCAIPFPGRWRRQSGLSVSRPGARGHVPRRVRWARHRDRARHARTLVAVWADGHRAHDWSRRTGIRRWPRSRGCSGTRRRRPGPPPPAATLRRPYRASCRPT